MVSSKYLNGQTMSEVYAFGTQAAGHTRFLSKHVSVCAMLNTADILFSQIGSSNICCIPFEESMIESSAEGVPVLAFASMPGENPTQMFEWLAYLLQE
jgi:hypothetical protein